MDIFMIRAVVFVIAAASLVSGVALFAIATRDANKLGQYVSTGMMGAALITVIFLGIV